MDPIQILSFTEKARERNFSDSLIKNCIKVLKRSRFEGDGGLWTNSLLIHLLENNTSKVSENLNFFTALRGDILIDNFAFQKTLTCQDLTLNDTFQTPFDDLIIGYNRRYPNKKITEETLIELELEEAIDVVGEEYGELNLFINDLTKPLNKVFTPEPFINQLYKAILLSVLSKIHPFDVFKKTLIPNIRSRKNNCKKDCLKFLVKIRDSKRISEKKLPTFILEEISERWDEFIFQSTITYIKDGVRDENYTKKYNDHCFYISELISKFGGSIALLLEELNSNKEESNWKHNEALLIYLKNQKIQVSPVDLLGNHNLQVDLNFEVKKDSLGILTTNPIWNPTVIENFEYLINKDNIEEKEFQRFFEVYPDFILDEIHVAALPQITLVNKHDNRKLRPDFILNRNNSNFVDILEIKRPLKTKLYSGKANREIPTLELLHYIRQIQEYKNFFRSNANRSSFRKKYALDGFEPVLSLLIGRKSSFGNIEILNRIMQGQNVNIITYDDILDMINLRVKRTLF